MKTLNIQNIVVPIDFSKMSMQAIHVARQLARRFGASIHLAHVRQFNYAADLMAPVPPMVPFAFTPYEHDAAESVLKKLKEVASECGVSSASCDVLSGAPPFDEVCRLGQTIPADLIVMPTHGRTGLKHVFLGSTAERIVQHSSCPVLVTRGSALQSNHGVPVRMKTILVPVDFSGCSREGLRYAIAFANEFRAKIILLHATYLGYVYSTEGTAIYDIPGLQKAARKTAERKMHELVRSVNFGAVKFETAFTDGSPVIDICAFAKDHQVDLIITSTHGFTGFKHVLIGSIAEQVVRHAPCSVLVVPSHPHVRAANLAKSLGAKARTPASSPRRIRPLADQPQPQQSSRGKALTKSHRQRTMKSLKSFALVSLLIANLVAPGALTANPATTPLTFANAVSFFKAAKFRATEVQPRCAIFFEGKWKSANLYDYCVIMVENSDQDIQVSFYLTDAHEMNWVTEFLDSQFFNRSETEKLFQLMNSRSDVRGQNVGRFRVDFHHWQPRHAQLLVFSFTPLR